jgi:hypothetical protein
MSKEGQTFMPWISVSQVAAEMGRKGGRSRSARKRRASRANARKATAASLVARRKRKMESGDDV